MYAVVCVWIMCTRAWFPEHNLRNLLLFIVIIYISISIIMQTSLKNVNQI